MLMGKVAVAAEQGMLRSEAILPTRPPAHIARSQIAVRRGLLSLTFVALLLLAWELTARRNIGSATAMPPPSAILGVLTQHHALLLQQASSTASECVLGFMAAIICGVLLGALIAYATTVAAALYPHIVLFQIIPKIALAPLFIVWLGVGTQSRLAFTVFSAFFPVAIATLTGLRATPASILALCRANVAPRWRVFMTVRFPFALPHIFSGLKAAVTMALIGQIVAEFITAQVGLGYIIKFAASSMETALVFAAIVLLCALGFALFAAVMLAQRVVMAKYGEP
jgi:NitT/TauT family transport system permease protein